MRTKREINLELDTLFRERDRRRAARSPELFARAVWKDEGGKPITLAPIHTRIHRFIAQCKKRKRHAFILAPWGHGKTETLLSDVAQEVCHDPNMRIKIVSNTDPNAMKRVGAVKQYIQGDPDLARIFPDIKVEGAGAETRFTLNRDSKSPHPTLEACGVMTSGMGGRCDRLLFDDPVDEKSLASAAHRETVTEKIENVWLSRLEPGGLAVWIGTAWHQDDYGQRIRNGAPDNGWDTLVIRVSDDLECLEVEETTLEGVEETTLPLWEARWPKGALAERLALLGSTAFWRGMGQREISVADQVFKDHHVMRMGRSDFPGLDTLQRYLSLDPAFKKSDRADWCAIACVGFDPKTKIPYLLEMDRFKGGPYDVAMKYIAAIRKWQPHDGGVEVNGGGEAVLKVIRAEMAKAAVSLRIQELSHSTDKILRIQTTIEPVVEHHPLVVDEAEEYDGFVQRFLATPASRLDEQDALEMAFDIARPVWQAGAKLEISDVTFKRRRA